MAGFTWKWGCSVKSSLFDRRALNRLRIKLGKRSLSTWMMMRIGRIQLTSLAKGCSLSMISEDRPRKRK